MLWPRRKRNSPTLPPHLELGKRGEKAAMRHLRQRGYRILLRNFRGKHGEIDIVARDHDMLVFVEVKTRRSETVIAPQAAVDRAKQKHLARVGFEYVRRLKNEPVRMRFDIVEVVMGDGDQHPRQIRLIQNAFELPAPYIY